MSCMGNGGDFGTKTVDVETLSDVRVECLFGPKHLNLHITSSP
jgi:hypothetical protein